MAQKWRLLPEELHWRMFAMTMCQALLCSSGHYYPDSMNQVESYVYTFINQSLISHYQAPCGITCLDWIWSSLTATISVSCIFGGFLLEFPLRRFGYRFTVHILHSMLQLTASLVAFLAVMFNSIELLFVGRVFMGLAVISSSIAAVFVADCAPQRYRGLLASSVYAGCSFWAMIATVAGLPQVLGTSTGWPYMVLVPVIPALLHLCATPWCPESPRYLYVTCQNRPAAIRSAHYYYGSEFNTDKIFREFERDLARSHTLHGTAHASWTEIWRRQEYRWPLILAIVINVGQDFGGVDIVSNYSTGVMTTIGIEQALAAQLTFLVTQLPSFVGIVISLLLIERVGRRFLILLGFSMGVLAVSLLFISYFFADDSVWKNILLLMGLLMSSAGYAIGPSLIGLFITSELCPQASRSSSTSVVYGFAWIPTLTVALLYPPLETLIGTLAVAPLIVLGVLSTAFLYKYLPETKGQSVEMVNGKWSQKNLSETEPLLNDQL